MFEDPQVRHLGLVAEMEQPGYGRVPEEFRASARFGGSQEVPVKLLVQGRHLEITDRLRGYTQAKANRLSRFFNPITKVHVIFNANKDSTYTAKVIVGLPRNKTIVYSENEKTLTAALDLAIDAIERKLNAFKDQLRGKGDREKAARQLMRSGGSA